MKKKIAILIFGIGIVVLAGVINHVFSNGSFNISEENNVITISNYNINNHEKVQPIIINQNQIKDIEYFPGFLIMNSNAGKQQNFTKLQVCTGTLARGINNVFIVSANDKGSGVYIKENDKSYLISTKTKEGTKELYNKLKNKEDFKMKC